MSKLSKWVDDNVTHKTAREKQIQMMNDQMETYRKEQKLIQDERGRLKSEKEEEQRRINEKKIRSMRRQYRSPGFLEEPASAPADKLG